MTEVNVTSGVTKKGITAALPSDVKQAGIVAKYDILKFLRSRRLLGMLIIEALVLVLITALLLTTDRSMSFNEVAREYISFASTLIIIAATLFGGDAIVSEFQGRTGYLLFPNPVKRWSILAGKFLSATGAMVLMLIIYYAVALAAGLAIGDGGASMSIVYSFLLAVLYGVSALAVAFLISSVMKGSTGSLILTFALFFFVFSIAGSLIGALGGIKPWFIPTFAGETLSYIMYTPYPVDEVIHTPLGPGLGEISTYLFYPEVQTSVVVMIAYTVVALGLAYLFFRRREMAA